jgi:hypothetical protein
MLTFVLWLILFVLSWPIALFGLFLYALARLILLPFRLLGFAVEGVFSIIRGLLLLPTRAVAHMR